MIRSALALARIGVFLALFSLAAGLGAQTSSSAGSGSASGKTSGNAAGNAAGNASVAPGTTLTRGETAKLAAARTALVKSKDAAALSSNLEACAFSLPAHDAVSLFREYLPRLEGGKKTELASLGGSLALMLGRYEDAAFIFRQVVRENPESGIEAARSYLAAGNVKEARAVLELLQGQPYEASLEGKKKIILAWLFLLEGKGEPAFVLLKDMVSLQGDQKRSDAAAQPNRLAQAGGAMENEALFLLWVLASTDTIRNFSAPSAGYEAAAMEALLKARYPRSAETAIIQRGILPSPGPWLLSEFFPFPESRSEVSAALGRPGADAKKQAPADPAKTNSAADAPFRLQVGWFSRKENASGLGASLKKSGFKVAVEEQKTQDGQARWAVIVDAEADWTKTQAKLKDLGYESYLLP